MENRSHALIAGVFTLLLAIAAVASLWWFGGSQEETRQYVVQTRRNVTGLNPQASVRYRGIQVGKVKSIELDPENVGNILFRIAIKTSVPVTLGTTATLETQGVTGIAHELLEDSGDDRSLRPAGPDGLPRIPMKDSLIQKLSDAGGRTLQDASAFLDRANQILSPENRRNLSAMLVNLEATSADARQVAARLRQLLTPENVQVLQNLITKAEQTADQAAPFFAEARLLVADLQVVSRKLDTALTDTTQETGALAPRLNELSSELVSSSRRLGRLLQMFEESPQSLLFGPQKPVPGPGEGGFRPPADNGGRP